MTDSLASVTFYAHEKATGGITEVALTLGLPEKKMKAQWRVTWQIDLNDEAGSERHAAGVDAWQALMLAIQTLKLEVDLLFRKKSVTFHYTREYAEKQTSEMSLEDLFPKYR